MHNQREDGSKMLKKRGEASLKDIFNYADVDERFAQ